ncbi:DMT family transporter [Haloplasma contractile]|uniref:Drug-metabolite transporter protein n=1 Tax=Haloplasma contractile SSD-17B TaxID=1033810 RepID=U2DU96_9MOLU|nr:DMT family transporter [Haloplasma contractile]ERJ11997.1 Drug-metabolite transporter protein [Haloplasma contractile SSD-17B]
MVKKTRKQITFTILMIIAMLFWGGSWQSGKIVSSDMPSEVLIFWRFFITFISFIPVMIYRKESIKLGKIGWVQVIVGTAFLVLYNLFFFSGLREGLSISGGVIVTTLNPLFTFLIASVILKHKGGKRELLGLGLGFFGGLILIEIWNIGKGTLFDEGVLFFLLAALSWALLSTVSQRSKSHMSAFTFSFYTYGLSAFIDLFFALPKGVFDFEQMSPSFWINVLYLSLGASTFGITAYFYAASNLGANKASTFTFIVPSSAMLFGFIILGEVPTRNMIFGGILALAAVYIINMKPKNHLKTTTVSSV